MSRYEHTQTQTAIATPLLGLGIFLLIPAIISGEPGLLALPIVLMLISMLGFALSQLTATVDADGVTASFRWGWPRRVTPWADIAAARTVRNKWWYGLGIRWVPGGWMYNVWGLDAVELDLAGRRKFRIGTDDPDGLLEAIQQVRGSA